MKKRCYIFLLLLLPLLAVSCSDRYKQGYNKGYADGLSRGQAVQIPTTKYAIRGFVFGILLGAVVVVYPSRRLIAAEFRKWRRKHQMRRLLGNCAVNLDPDIYSRVLEIGLRKKRLEDDIERDGGKFIQMFDVKMRAHLQRMGESIVELATLMQQLRDTRAQIAGDEAASTAEIKRLEGLARQSSDDKEKTDLEEAIAVHRMKLAALHKNEVNSRRSEVKLSTLSGFLDNLIIEMANMRTLQSHEVFEKFEQEVCKEIEHLENVVERTLADLAKTHSTTPR